MGLATGGGLVLAFGAVTSIVVDAGTFVLAAVLCVGLPLSRAAADAVARGLLHGYKVLFSEPRLRAVVIVLVALASVSSLPETLAPEIATGGWQPWLLASQAAGTAVGGAVLGSKPGLERMGPLSIGLTGTGVSPCLAGLVASSAGMLTLANFVLGLMLAVAVIGQTMFVRNAPPEQLGATTAAAITLVMISEGVGAVVVATIAEVASPGIAYTSCGAAALARVLAVSFVLRGRRAHGESTVASVGAR